MGYPTYDYTFNKYQEEAQSTVQYLKEYSILYPAMGVCGEAGEMLEKVKKAIRHYGLGWKEKIDRDQVILELGDVLWYIQATAKDMGYSLEDVARMNIIKLRDRRARNVVKGEGDNR